jgi:hypothetical protein
LKRFFTERVGLQAGIAVLALLAIAVIAPHALHGLAPLAGVGMMPFVGMMYDAGCLLSDSQALTAGTTVSGNTYDSGAATRSFDVGTPMCIAFVVTVAAVTGGGETYQFQAIEDSNANLATAVLILAQSALIPGATLKAGYRFYLPIPPGIKTKRYVGARYVLAGGASAVTVKAFLQPLSMVQNDKTYANGYKISS